MVKLHLSSSHRKAIRKVICRAIPSRLVVFALLSALLTTFLWSNELLAQVPRNFRIPPLDLPDVESSEADAATETLPEDALVTKRVIVDTDPGIDDAAALIWLFSQQRYDVDVEAVVTVSGNTNVDQATNNAQLILEWLEADATLVKGSATPLVQPPSLVPALIHGLDGLWFTGGTTSSPDFTDSTAFYCATLEPGIMVIALGPLTNIAKAMDATAGGCPAKWSGVELVSLGGSRQTPNQTPVTEYNYWQDPEAVEAVLRLGPASGATIQIVLSDAFSQFEIARSDIRQLDRRGNDAIQNLLPALDFYMQGFEAGGETPTLPDPSAVIYALENRLGTGQLALVNVLSGEGIPEVARGQTIIALSFNEHITMIASDAELSDLALQFFTTENFDLEGALFEIFLSQPDNATVVTDIDARRMHNIFIQGLRVNNTVPTSGAGEETEQSDYDNHIFVPQVMDQE